MNAWIDNHVRQVADLYVRDQDTFYWAYGRGYDWRAWTERTQAHLQIAYWPLVDDCGRSKDVFRQAVLRTLPGWVPPVDLMSPEMRRTTDEVRAETVSFFLDGLEDAEWPAPFAVLDDLHDENDLDDLGQLDDEDELDEELRAAQEAQRPFRYGDRVVSGRWGAGLVLTSEANQADEKVEVLFRDPRVGQRLLLRSLANLERLVLDQAGRLAEVQEERRAAEAADAAAVVLSRWLAPDDVLTEWPLLRDRRHERCFFDGYYVYAASVSHLDGTVHAAEGPTLAAVRLYLAKRLATNWLADQLREHGFVVSHLVGYGNHLEEWLSPCESVVALAGTDSGTWSPNADPPWQLSVDVEGGETALEAGVSRAGTRITWPPGGICDLISARSHPAGVYECTPVCGLARRLVLSPSSPADWAMVAEAMDEDIVPPERFRDFEWDEEPDEEWEEEGGTFGAFPYSPGT